MAVKLTENEETEFEEFKAFALLHPALIIGLFGAVIEAGREETKTNRVDLAKDFFIKIVSK